MKSLYKSRKENERLQYSELIKGLQFEQIEPCIVFYQKSKQILPKTNTNVSLICTPGIHAAMTNPQNYDSRDWNHSLLKSSPDSFCEKTNQRTRDSSIIALRFLEEHLDLEYVNINLIQCQVESRNDHLIDHGKKTKTN